MLGVSILFVIGMFMIGYGGFKINDAAGFIITGTLMVIVSTGFSHQIDVEMGSDNKNKGDN